jgi:hypothetical protein
MKSFALVLLAVSAAVASPLVTVGGQQFVLSENQQYPGFNVDLSERRLVEWQRDGNTETRWMTELEKASLQAVTQTCSDLLLDST